MRGIYDSDVDRLSSLEEGGSALMATSHRPCPLCGADPEQEVARAQRAARAEIAKITLERSDLISVSLRAEQEGFARSSERMAQNLLVVDQQIADARPREAASRSSYEEIARVRDHVRAGIALSKRDAHKQRKAELGKFKAISVPKSEINVGVSLVIGHELAMAVQSVLRACHFPANPTVSFNATTHDILIDGKSRESNGKGVRALMNAALLLPAETAATPRRPGSR